MKILQQIANDLCKRLGLSFVIFYRHWISPHKGFRCAHAAVTGGESCSEAAVRILSSEVSARDSIRLIGEQRLKCKDAYIEFKGLKNDAEKMMALAPVLAAGDTIIKCC